jgi:1,4-dihydroxy-2-naphthoate octaprenyltransferase
MNQLAVVAAYAVIIYLVFLPHYFTPIMLIVLFAGKRALTVIGVLSKPKPAEPPANWPGWPVWFSGFAFFHNRMFGGLFILGLLIDTILRVIPFTADLINKFWPLM